MSNPFQAWRRAMLSTRGMSAADGRPLFEYRITQAEFAELEALLQRQLAAYQQHTDLATVAANVTRFPDLFVLYASEWWRRRFDGSHWSWEPILDDLGADGEGWTPAQRSICVELGLKQWKLDLHAATGMRYLGSIALQGGLPMRLLATAHGQVGRLLGKVLREAARSTVTPAQIAQWVSSLDHDLPQTYRRAEIHRLLAGVIHTVLVLRDEADLTASADAVPALDAKVPRWRERFPLPIEEGHAQGIIEQLIRDAGSVRVERRQRLFSVTRELLPEGADAWQLHSTIDLPETVSTVDLELALGIGIAVQPAVLELQLQAGETGIAVGLRRMAGRACYRVERRPLGAFGADAAAEHVLHLAAPDGRRWSVSAPGGEALEEDLPWVFDAGETSPVLLRQGGGRVAAAQVWLLAPAWAAVSPGERAERTLSGLERTAWSLAGDAEVQLADGERARIRVGQAGADGRSAHWSGERVWHYFQPPWQAFAGRPQRLIIDADDTVEAPRGPVEWRPLGVRQNGTGSPLGPVHIWQRVAGEQQGKTRMVVLPAQAKTRVLAEDAHAGVILLEHWGAVGAAVVDSALHAEVQVLGAAADRAGPAASSLRIALRCAPGARAPEAVDVDVVWPTTPHPVRLRLPFPARGARCFDGAGRELAAGSRLSTRQLSGVRLILSAGDPSQPSQARLQLASGARHRTLSQAIHFAPEAAQAELRLTDFATEITHLLAHDDDADAEVLVAVEQGGVRTEVLRIARYAADVELHGDDLLLDAQSLGAESAASLAATQVLALRLERPGDEPVALSATESAGVATGAWRFAPQAREPGSWLLYPAPGAAIAFRPTLWPVPGDAALDGPFAAAIGTPVQAEREAALLALIDTLAADYRHPVWSEVERLAGQLEHLPLTTLDIWRCFARRPQGMAALALRFGQLPDGFVERFAQELPLVWEALPYAAWEGAMQRLEQQCQAQYGPMVGATIAQSHRDSRIQALGSRYAALLSPLTMARAAVTGEIPKELALFRQLEDQAIARHLFEEEDCPLQVLLRGHHDNAGAETEWPEQLDGLIALVRHQLGHAEMFNARSYDYRDSVIQMPVALALQVARGATEAWFASADAVDDLRSYMAFDPEWFAEAYMWTLARCYRADLLQGEAV